MPNQKNLNRHLQFLHQAEKLKTLLRHSWLSSGRRESVAEHTWRMALMAMLFHQHLQKKNRPNLEKVLKMIIVHDLSEIYAGDAPAFKKDKAKKSRLEAKAIVKIAKHLPINQRAEIISLWKEYQGRKSLEAKFAKALDRLEVLIQHAEADIKYCTKKELRFNLVYGIDECEFDPFLRSLRKKVNKDFVEIYKLHRISKKLYE